MQTGTGTHTRPGTVSHPVGVGELAVSSDPYEVLVTYSLGSCVGLALYDPELGAGGLIHCQLPLSRMDKEQARTWPARFTDTGVSLLLQKLFDLGARRDRLVAKAAGGSSNLDENGRFRIGERNVTVLRKVLWKNDIVLAGCDFGGKISRTMYLHLTDGRTELRISGTMTEL